MEDMIEEMFPDVYDDPTLVDDDIYGGLNK